MVKNPPANAGDARDAGSIPRLGRSPGGGHGNPLQYSCLENPRRAWWATAHRVAESNTNEATEHPHTKYLNKNTNSSQTSQKTEEKGTFPKSLYEASINWDIKTRQRLHKKTTDQSLMNTDSKILNKILANGI